MTAPADIEPAIEVALIRATAELAEIARLLARVELLLHLIAGVTEAK